MLRVFSPTQAQKFREIPGGESIDSLFCFIPLCTHDDIDAIDMH